MQLHFNAAKSDRQTPSSAYFTQETHVAREPNRVTTALPAQAAIFSAFAPILCQVRSGGQLARQSVWADAADSVKGYSACTEID
jgi:hypothetical protein